MKPGQELLWAACDAVAEHRRDCDRCWSQWQSGVPLRCDTHEALEAARNHERDLWAADLHKQEKVSATRQKVDGTGTGGASLVPGAPLGQKGEAHGRA